MIDTVHICIAADSNYKLPLVCLVKSIVLNSASHPCVVHVLFSGLSARYRRNLISKFRDTNVSFDFIDMSKYAFDFKGLDMQHWTRAIFYRMMIPEIFKNLDRILYIDCDTLVLSDLFDFFNTEFTVDTDIAMAVDKFSWKSQIAKLKTKNYFNSGMILFDINKCRQSDFSNKCVRWLHDNPEIATFPDQDAINAVCDGRILRVNNIYNKQFAPNETISSDVNPVIIHFLSAIKPWMWRAPIKYSQIYRLYMPNKLCRLRTVLSQFLYHSKHWCFHKTNTMKLEKIKVVEYIKYYVFNICIHTSVSKKQHMDIVSMLKYNKDKADVHK